MLDFMCLRRASRSPVAVKGRPLRLAIERLEDRSLLTGVGTDFGVSDWADTDRLEKTVASSGSAGREPSSLEAALAPAADSSFDKIPTGDFSLETFDVAQQTMGDGQKAAVLQIVVTPRQRFPEPTIELATIGLLFEESAGDPLSDAEANSLISRVQIYRDRGNHLFDPLDTLLTTVHTLGLDDGAQSVVLPIDEPSTQVEFGFSRTFFVAIELTGNAAEQSVQQFRVTHLTEGPYASTAVRQRNTRDEGFFIDGNDLFVLDDDQSGRLYSENTGFTVGVNDELLTPEGQRVLGFGVDDGFQIQTTQLTPLVVPIGSATAGIATKKVELEGTLIPDGIVADTAEILSTGILGDGQFTALAAGATVQPEFGAAGLIGNYSYFVTFADAAGGPGNGRESRPTPVIGPLNVVNGRIQMNNLPVDTSGQWSVRRIYRNLASNSSEFYFVVEIPNNLPGQTFTDNVPDATIMANAQLDRHGPRITNDTLLTDVLRFDGTNYNQVFQTGSLEFRPEKGGRDIYPTTDPGAQFTITAASTVADLVNFMDEAMGIQSPPGPDAANPIPGDIAGVNPGGSVSANGEIRFVSNNGLANALRIGLSDMQLATGGRTRNINMPFRSTQATAGEGAVADFLVFDSPGIALNVRVTAVLERSTSTQTTYRWFADSPDNDPASGVDVAVGTGLVIFDGEGNFLDRTNTTVSIAREHTASHSPLQFELDFTQVSGLASETGSSLFASQQDGGSPHVLVDYDVDPNGLIIGSFANGATRTLGQLRLARFDSAASLQRIGPHLFAPTGSASPSATGNPGDAGFGAIAIGPVVQVIPLELGRTQNDSSSIIQLDATRPTIVDVMVSGSGWSASLMDYLHASGQGTGGFSIIGDGSSPRPTIAWDNVDQIRVAFSEPVIVELADLMLVRADGNRYFPATLTTDGTNPTEGFFATWTFKQSLGPENLMGILDDAIEDIAGNRLDQGSGGGASPQARLAGGVALEASFPLDLLPGDANGDGRVDAGDYTAWANSQGLALDAGLVPADFNADGAFTTDDYQVWSRNFGRTSTTAAVAAPAAMRDVSTSVRTAVVEYGESEQFPMTARGSVSMAVFALESAGSSITSVGFVPRAIEPRQTVAPVRGGAQSLQTAPVVPSDARFDISRGAGQDERRLDRAFDARRLYATHGASDGAREPLLEAVLALDDDGLRFLWPLAAAERTIDGDRSSSHRPRGR